MQSNLDKRKFIQRVILNPACARARRPNIRNVVIDDRAAIPHFHAINDFIAQVAGSIYVIVSNAAISV